jgi:hypothetical protein
VPFRVLVIVKIAFQKKCACFVSTQHPFGTTATPGPRSRADFGRCLLGTTNGRSAAGGLGRVSVSHEDLHRRTQPCASLIDLSIVEGLSPRCHTTGRTAPVPLSEQCRCEPNFALRLAARSHGERFEIVWLRLDLVSAPFGKPGCDWDLAARHDAPLKLSRAYLPHFRSRTQGITARTHDVASGAATSAHAAQG